MSKRRNNKENKLGNVPVGRYKAADIRLFACPDCNAMGLLSKYMIPLKRIPRWLDNKFMLRCIVCGYERPHVGYKWNQEEQDDDILPMWIPLYHEVDQIRGDRLVELGELILVKVEDDEQDNRFMRYNDGKLVVYDGR